MTALVVEQTLAERLLADTVRDGDCLRWTGAHTPKGYGQVRWDGRVQSVHRLAHELWVGPIPDGHDVDHVRDRGCLHRDCIEPTHLEAVTHAENVRRGRRRPRLAECRKGHELTPANIYVRPGTTRHECRTCRKDRRHA